MRGNNRSILGQNGNALVMLMVILAVVFCIFKFIQLAFIMSQSDYNTASASYHYVVHRNFILPASLTELAVRPWTLLSFQFFHDGVFHMIGNLFWLWIFGFILQDLAGNKTIFPLFIYSSLAGAAFYLLAFNLLPVFRPFLSGTTLEGASAGIMGIAVATTILTPGYRFFPMINGGIPLWVVTVIYVIIDLAMIAGLSNAGGHIAHLGGGLFGWLYMRRLQQGHDWGQGLNRFFHWCNALFQPPAPTSKRKEHFYDTSGARPYHKVPHLTQKKIDAILDKIGKEGMDKLSDEERQILRRAASDDTL